MIYTVFGSCVTRDVFRIVRQDAAVRLYIARTSVVSAVDPPLTRNVVIALESAFERRQVHNDLYKDLIPGLTAPGLTVVIDLVGEGYALLRVDGTHLTCSYEMMRSGVVGQLGPDELVQAESEQYRRLFAARAALFGRLIHPTSTVILHKALWAEEYQSRGNRRRFECRLAAIRRMNAHLRFCYRELETALAPHVVSAAPELRLATDTHLWGLAPAHFVDEYYWDVWRQIEELRRRNRGAEVSSQHVHAVGSGQCCQTVRSKLRGHLSSELLGDTASH